MELTPAAEIARDYYNSTDADEFYWRVWGSSDIHVGIYHDAGEPIETASRRTVAHLAALLDPLEPDTRVLDLGSGFCGPARFLAAVHHCRVTAVNISQVEIARSIELNRESGLDDRIEVVEASMEEIPLPDAGFDVVWSQDALLHCGDRQRVFAGVSRLLEPGGEFVFTDPMEAEGCPPEVRQPILDRLHLSSLGSPAVYRQFAAEVGLEVVEFEDMTAQFARHYRRVLEETESRRQELEQWISSSYLDRMSEGLQHWISGGLNRHLAWGCFHLRKP